MQAPAAHGRIWWGCHSAPSGRQPYDGEYPGRCPGLSHSAPLGPQQQGMRRRAGVRGWGVRGWGWHGLVCNGPNGARGDSPGQSPGMIGRIVGALKGRNGVCPVVRCEPWGGLQAPAAHGRPARRFGPTSRYIIGPMGQMPHAVGGGFFGHSHLARQPREGRWGGS